VFGKGYFYRWEGATAHGKKTEALFQLKDGAFEKEVGYREVQYNAGYIYQCSYCRCGGGSRVKF
jgi:hypothetical protein